MPHLRIYRVLIWFLLTSGLLTACKIGDRPNNLIDIDKMVGILTDVHMAETRVSRLGIASTDSSNLVYKRLEARILRKHDVDSLTYENSYIYYSSHPRDMETIYKQIVAKLEAQINATHKKPAKK